jgi:hypothetical protein
LVGICRKIGRNLLKNWSKLAEKLVEIYEKFGAMKLALAKHDRFWT